MKKRVLKKIIESISFCILMFGALYFISELDYFYFVKKSYEEVVQKNEKIIIPLEETSDINEIISFISDVSEKYSVSLNMSSLTASKNVIHYNFIYDNKGLLNYPPELFSFSNNQNSQELYIGKQIYDYQLTNQEKETRQIEYGNQIFQFSKVLGGRTNKELYDNTIFLFSSNNVDVSSIVNYLGVVNNIELHIYKFNKFSKEDTDYLKEKGVVFFGDVIVLKDETGAVLNMKSKSFNDISITLIYEILPMLMMLLIIFLIVSLYVMKQDRYDYVIRKALGATNKTILMEIVKENLSKFIPSAIVSVLGYYLLSQIFQSKIRLVLYIWPFIFAIGITFILSVSLVHSIKDINKSEFLNRLDGGENI